MHYPKEATDVSVVWQIDHRPVAAGNEHCIVFEHLLVAQIAQFERVLKLWNSRQTLAHAVGTFLRVGPNRICALAKLGNTESLCDPRIGREEERKVGSLRPRLSCRPLDQVARFLPPHVGTL